MKAEILSQIRNITSSLIGMSLSEEQTFPSDRNGKVYISGSHDLSIALKNIPYSDIYNILEKDKNFNVKMIDGALIQIMYTFNNEELLKYRMAFFPSPYLVKYQNNPQLYLEDSIFSNILSENIVPTPIRFDYDPSSHNDPDHPVCHVTIGQYKSCRIPVSKIITPNIFIDFILRNFYNTSTYKFTDEISYNSFIAMETTITENESRLLHFHITKNQG